MHTLLRSQTLQEILDTLGAYRVKEQSEQIDKPLSPSGRTRSHPTSLHEQEQQVCTERIASAGAKLTRRLTKIMNISSHLGGLQTCYKARSYHRTDIKITGMTELKLISESNIKDATELCHEQGLAYSPPTANMRTWVKYAPDGVLLTYMVCTIINLVSPGASATQSLPTPPFSLPACLIRCASQAASASRSNTLRVATSTIRLRLPSSRSSIRSVAVVAKPSSLRNPSHAQKHRRSGRGV